MRRMGMAATVDSTSTVSGGAAAVAPQGACGPAGGRHLLALALLRCASRGVSAVVVVRIIAWMRSMPD